MVVTKINMSRNWALRKAEDMIKSDSESARQIVKSDWKERTVSVNSKIVFHQVAVDLKGSFVHDYVALKFP